MSIDLIWGKAKFVQAIGKIAAAVLPIIFFSFLILRLARADLFEWVNEKRIAPNARYEATSNSENTDWRYLEGVEIGNLPLIINWPPDTNSGSSDKYMDKQIVETSKNNWKKEFYEVKIEFTVYDEGGG
jgi:hypothetical protein